MVSECPCVRKGRIYFGQSVYYSQDVMCTCSYYCERSALNTRSTCLHKDLTWGAELPLLLCLVLSQIPENMRLSVLFYFLSVGVCPDISKAVGLLKKTDITQ